MPTVQAHSASSATHRRVSLPGPLSGLAGARRKAFEAGPAVTLEQAVRLAALGLPPRPTPLELDPATGDITWPRLLTESIYHDLTSRIQEHFHRRLAAGGSLDFATAEDCLGSFDQLAARLREQAGRRPAGQHGAAKNFLEGLWREYELPP